MMAEVYPNNCRTPPGAEIWPRFDQTCPSCAKRRPMLENYGQCLANIDQLWQKLACFGPLVAKSWSTVAKSGNMLTNSDHIWSNLAKP